MNFFSRGRRRASFSQLTRKQRRALMALGVVNLVVLSVFIAILLRAPSPARNALVTSPLSHQRLELCRQKISRALLDAGQSGIVQTQPNGTILIQTQRPSTLSNLRLDADATTWAVLEAVAAMGPGGCLDFNALQVTILLGAPDLDYGQATARVGLADLRLWSQGKIDDAELALRLDYHLPSYRDS